MTDITPYEYIPADVAAPEPARPRLLVLATSLVSVAIGMGFLGLIGYYIGWRQDVLATGERWLPDGVDIPLTQPNFMGVTLAFSLITIWWSVASIRRDDRSNALVAFVISILFGIAFLAQTSYLFTIMQMDILADERSALIYGIIGTHMVLMLVAMGFALGGEYSARDYEGVLSSALFWTMIVALYGVQWYAIYITK